MAAIGYALQRLVLNRTLGEDLLPPLLVTFGLSVIIQNGLLAVFTADSRKLQAGEIEVATIRLFEGVYVGLLPLLQRSHETRGQVFLTCTDENWPQELARDLHRWEVRAGTLQAIK